MSALRPYLPFARRLGAAVVLVYALTSLALGGTRAARPVFLGLTAGCAVGLGLRLRPGGRAGRLLGVADLAATNVAVTLVLAEVALRLLGPSSLLVSDQLDAHRLAPGRDYEGGLRGNALGYPGPDFVLEKRPGVFRIAALGDSFAVGPAVRWEENYLTRLERTLPGVEVYNFGISGTGPREYELILRRDVWTYQPDLVLVSVFVGNDITETLATPRHLDPRRHALYLLLSRSWRLAAERWRGAPGPLDGGVDRPAGPTLSEESFREIEARRLAVCLAPPPPGLEKKWQSALRYLERLTDDCRDHAVPLAVVLIPDEFQVNPHVLSLAREKARVGECDVDLEGPQRRLAQFWKDRQVPCLDLLPALRSTPDTYALRDTHWNARGNRLAAQEIADWMARCGLLPAGDRKSNPDLQP